MADGLALPHPDPAMRLARGHLRQLTPREREVLALLGKGCGNREIARGLSISERTVKGHLSRIFAKLKVRSRVEAALILARLDMSRE